METPGTQGAGFFKLLYVTAGLKGPQQEGLHWCHPAQDVHTLPQIRRVDDWKTTTLDVGWSIHSNEIQHAVSGLELHFAPSCS